VCVRNEDLGDRSARYRKPGTEDAELFIADDDFAVFVLRPILPAEFQLLAILRRIHQSVHADSSADCGSGKAPNWPLSGSNAK